MDNLNTFQNYFAHVLHCTCLADMLRIASFDRPGCRLGQNALPHTHNQSVWRSQTGQWVTRDHGTDEVEDLDPVWAAQIPTQVMAANTHPKGWGWSCRDPQV